MIEIKNLTRKFSGIKVVDSVDFQVTPGEIVGLLGPNGAGKTTTIKMITGLLQPTFGSVICDGRDIRSNLANFRAKLGYVPENAEIYPHLGAREYLQLVGRLRGLTEKVLNTRIESLLQLIGLDHDFGAIASFSKGMRQKVLLLAALLHDPEILVLDEPLSGLDVTTSMVVRTLIKMLAAERKTVIYSSHVLEVAEKICSRVVILDHGCVMADNSVENLRNVMSLPSLADVFNRLVVHEDPAKVAAKIIELTKNGPPGTGRGAHDIS